MTIEATEIEGPDRFAELDLLIENIQQALDDPDSISDNPRQFIVSLTKMVNDAVDVVNQLTPADFEQFYEEGEQEEDDGEEEGSGSDADYFR